MPIPAGWINTGLVTDQVLSFDFTIKPFWDFIEPLEIEGWRIGVAGEQAAVDGFSDDTPFLSPPCPDGTLGAYQGERTSYQVYLRLASHALSTRVTLPQAMAGDCDPGYFPAMRAEKRLGPLMLGVTYEYNTAQDRWRLRYSLFANASTRHQLTLGGRTVEDTAPYSSVTEVGFGDGLTFILPRQGSVDSPYLPTPTNVVKIASLTANGFSVPLAGVKGQWTITGTEVAEAPLVVIGGDQANNFYAPLAFDHDVDVRDAGGGQTSATVALNVLNIAGLTTHTESVVSPSTGSHVLPMSSWAGTDTDGRIIAAITDYPKSPAPGGGPSVDPDMYAVDRALRFSHTRPKAPGAESFWPPMTAEILSPNSILRSTNAWTGSGPIAISGSDFTVSGTGATVTRTLNSKWRNWNSISDANYHVDDGWTTTKHDFYGDGNQDVWGWSLYRYLDWSMTCSVAATLTLTATVAVVSPAGGVFTFTRSYSAAFPSGHSTQRIDLLFPQEAGAAPCYIERVDAIQLSGFAAGDYTLESFALVCASAARVKIAAAGGWPGLVVSQDGSFPASQWGIDPAVDLTATPIVHKKHDEDGFMRSDSGDDYYGGCVRMDSTLSATASEWNRMEGVTSTYDGAQMEADLTDNDGNRIGFVDGFAVPAVPQAAWLHAQLPALTVPPNTLARFPASLRCDTLAICPMPVGTFKAIIRERLGMVLEAVVVTSDGKSAPAGRQVQARRRVGADPAGSDPVLASGTTDANGAVEVAIRVGTYGSQEGTVYSNGA